MAITKSIVGTRIFYHTDNGMEISYPTNIVTSVHEESLINWLQTLHKDSEQERVNSSSSHAASKSYFEDLSSMGKSMSDKDSQSWLNSYTAKMSDDYNRSLDAAYSMIQSKSPHCADFSKSSNFHNYLKGTMSDSNPNTSANTNKPGFIQNPQSALDVLSNLDNYGINFENNNSVRSSVSVLDDLISQIECQLVKQREAINFIEHKMNELTFYPKSTSIYNSDEVINLPDGKFKQLRTILNRLASDYNDLNAICEFLTSNI